MTATPRTTAKPVDVAAYFFPGYHADPSTSRWHGNDWTEWELVRDARPRYPGHRQPRVPAWGYFDEADPLWAMRQAQEAKAAGIGAFIFDWYWYNNGPFLNGALDNGFLASSELPIDFAIMWANHDWLNIHPASAAHPPHALFRGRVSDAEFDRMADTIIERYFAHPRYYRIEGDSYFSIYEPQTFIDGMGGPLQAARAIERFRERSSVAGVGDIHVNIVTSERAVLPGERTSTDLAATVRDFAAASVTSYVWIHHYDPSTHGFPQGDYDQAQHFNQLVWAARRRDLSIPYFPNVTVGWDSSPRVISTDSFENRGYPWTAVLDSAPQQYEAALTAAIDFAAADPSRSPGLVTINAWNEWTEGSYLLPDDDHGMSFLDATARATKNMPAPVRAGVAN
ncbi:MAG: glycoside hydrolase family 99-like domain-containing protein [Mycetocola sp.]